MGGTPIDFDLVFIVLVVLPLSFFQGCRSFAAQALLIASYIIGLTVWVEAFLVNMISWGTIAVVIGVLLGGIGILPVRILATLFHGSWSQFFDLIILTAVTYGSRVYAVSVADKTYAVEHSRLEAAVAATRGASVADRTTRLAEGLRDDKNTRSAVAGGDRRGASEAGRNVSLQAAAEAPPAAESKSPPASLPAEQSDPLVGWLQSQIASRSVKPGERFIWERRSKHGPAGEMRFLGILGPGPSRANLVRLPLHTERAS